MFNKEIIDKLNNIFKEFKYVKSPIDYEYANSLLEKEVINDSLNELFSNKNGIIESELYSITNNEILIDVIKLFIIRNNIIIYKDESLALSDLSLDLRLKKEELSKHIEFTDEEIEMLLEDLTKQNREVIMNSRLNYIFDKTLLIANDELIFEELYSDATEILLSSIYRYDKNIHKSFREYLDYNLETILNKRQMNYIHNHDYINEDNIYVDGYSDLTDERLDNIELLSNIFSDSKLSSLERNVIEYLYGVKDGMTHSIEETALEYNLNKIAIMQIKSATLSKLNKTQKKKSR